jgi:leader peptidase (prepilin peptidase)/N-methyltransferase
MNTALFIFSFLFGAIIGSFLNVVIIRYNTGKSLKGRSKCVNCSKELSWHELLPVLSYLLQRGSCKGCKSKISLQYPLVELVTGILFVLVFYVFPPIDPDSSFLTTFHLFIASLLVVISVYDIKHKIIPDQFVYIFIALSFLSLFLSPTLNFVLPSYQAFIAGPIMALPFALLWVVSRGQWIGFGDAKLSLGIGWILGLSMAVNAFVLSFWIAAVVSLVWMLFTYHKFKARTEIPFGPYLVLGMYIELLLHIQIINIGLVKDLISSLF